MAKKPAKKTAKKRVSKYDEKFKIDLTFEEALKLAINTPKKKK